NRQNWADAGHRIARCYQNQLSLLDRFNRAWSRFGVRGTREAHRFDWILKPALYKIFFEAELAGGGRHDPRLNPRVTHRQDARRDSELTRDLCRGLRQRHAVGQQLGAHQMYGQVTVAGMEPDRLSQLPHRLQALKGVALDAPAALL